AVKRATTAGLAVQYNSAGPAYRHPSDALIWNNATATCFQIRSYPACKSFILLMIGEYE
ncbi:hypothetical protein QBC45DRAFT_302390, partial [Copromyces sp. CBS 386.78]